MKFTDFLTLNSLNGRIGRAHSSHQYRLMKLRQTIAVAGALAQRPLYGGHTWVFLQYILGLQRLGWDVLFIDRLEPDMCGNESGEPCPPESSRNLRYLVDVMKGFGLEDRWALLFDRGSRVFGLPRKEVLHRLRQSAFLLNVMGYLEDEEILAAASRRVFLDIDPGFGQMWQALGQAELFHGHDDYVTIGENIGAPGCDIPTLDIEWITSRPPVVLDHWTVDADHGTRFTTVASWRGVFDPVLYEGRKYGLRVHEFRRFFELPRRTGREFEIALDIEETDSDDLQKLKKNEWIITNPAVAASDPWEYRDYVRASKAEFMVAKNMYVETHSGWFSDRSACYLATGRPVVAQDTGLASLLPTGEGLLVFDTLDEAVQCVNAVNAEYDRHARAARQVAAEYFDSDIVLSRLLARLGVG